MAVFVAASDESAGKDRNDHFVWAGLLANEKDWSELFAPAWQKLVLDGPPKIDYLHMTEMRSRAWRESHGITNLDASQRIDRAVQAIGVSDFLFPIGLTVKGKDIRDAFIDAKVKYPVANRSASPFKPDFLCFLGYAMMVLDYVSTHHPECERVDFVVEKNGNVTDFIKVFHDSLNENFAALGLEKLSKLVGELLPVSKERIPVQAADVLCWHSARARNTAMKHEDQLRFDTLSQKPGRYEPLSRELVMELAEILQKKHYPVTASTG